MLNDMNVRLFYSFSCSSGWISRTSVTTSLTWWCAGWWRGLCCGRALTGGKCGAMESGLKLPPPRENLHPSSCAAATTRWAWGRTAPNLEWLSSEATGRRPDSGRVSRRREGKEQSVSEIRLWKGWTRKRTAERWEDGRRRWIRGVDVEDASTTETLSCTILR